MRTMVPTARQHQEEIQFRLILAATYPFFLAAATLEPRACRPASRRAAGAGTGAPLGLRRGPRHGRPGHSLRLHGLNALIRDASVR